MWANVSVVVLVLCLLSAVVANIPVYLVFNVASERPEFTTNFCGRLSGARESLSGLCVSPDHRRDTVRTFGRNDHRHITTTKPDTSCGGAGPCA